jgi:hypothetical protein
MRAGAHPTSSKPRASSPAVPLTCPKQRSATVGHGQQRSLTEVPDLRHRRKVGSPTLLPKLVMPSVDLAPDFGCNAGGSLVVSV